MRRACALVLACALAPAAAAAGTLHGVVTDDHSDAHFLAGVTVVATTPGGTTAAAEITDEGGAYTLDVPAGVYTLTAYYADLSYSRMNVVALEDGGDTTVAPFWIDVDAATGETGCRLGPPPMYDGAVQTARTSTTALVRRRDHAGAGALDPRLDPARTATSIDGAPRLPGAPAIALELIGDQTSHAGFAPIVEPGASGGTDALALVHGSNQVTGDARLALARASRFAAIVGAPIVEDHAWASNGIVLDQTAAGLDVQALGTVDAAAGNDAMFAASALVTRGADGRRDAWAQARAIIKGDDGKQRLELGLVAERLDTGPAPPSARAAAPRVIDRLGGRLILVRRLRGRGYHEATIGGELGGGHAGATGHRDDANRAEAPARGADGVAHTDVRAFAGDVWQPLPWVSIDAGVRWERRVLGAAAAAVWAPRLAVAWDPTKEGRVNLFAGVERAAHLDERGFGAWTDGDLAGDTAIAGAEREWLHVRWTAAVRGRRAGERRDAGFEGIARTSRDVDDERWVVEARVSTLARAATLSASWRSARGERHTYALAAIARATPDDLGWGARADLGLRRRRFETTLGVEAFDLDDAARRAAHLVLTAHF